MATAKINNTVMTIPALNQPFHPGMLFNYRTQQLIPGYTLWEEEHLSKYITVKPQPSTEFKFSSKRDISSKANSLGVDGQLKLSIMAGAIQLDGAATYLNETKKNENELFVSFHYKCTTHHKQLTMEHLAKGQIDFPDVFATGLATHVVTGVIYGAQAFFSFTQKVSETRNKSQAQGKFELAIGKLPKFISDSKIAVKGETKDEDCKNLEELECEFKGDIYLPNKIPLTYTDAIELCQQIPTLIGSEGERTIPITVTLLPLDSIMSKKEIILQEISAEKIQELQDIMEEISNVRQTCAKLKQSKSCTKAKNINLKIETFEDIVGKYKDKFQQKLMLILPEVRGGNKTEKVLLSFIRKHKDSPFHIPNMYKWLDECRKEIRMIDMYLEVLEEVQFANEAYDLDVESIRHDCMVCLIIGIPDVSEAYLNALNIYLDRDQVKKIKGEKENWYMNKDLTQYMLKEIKSFKYEINTNAENNIKSLRPGSL